MNPTRSFGAPAEMLLFFLAFFLPGYLAQGSLPPAGPVSSLTLLQSILSGAPQFLLMVYVVTRPGPEEARRWGLVPLEARDAARAALLLACCFAVAAPFVALSLALPAPWNQSLATGYRWGLGSAAQLPIALFFGLTAGYREEFFFRPYLLGRLGEIGVRAPLAVIASTALFAAGHIYEGPLGVLMAAALGALFSAAYLRRPSLHLVAIVHGLYNVIVLALSLLLPPTLPAAFALRIFFTK
jgi:hypothetical protein